MALNWAWKTLSTGTYLLTGCQRWPTRQFTASTSFPCPSWGHTVVLPYSSILPGILFLLPLLWVMPHVDTTMSNKATSLDSTYRRTCERWWSSSPCLLPVFPSCPPKLLACLAHCHRNLLSIVRDCARPCGHRGGEQELNNFSRLLQLRSAAHSRAGPLQVFGETSTQGTGSGLRGLKGLLEVHPQLVYSFAATAVCNRALQIGWPNNVYFLSSGG